MCEITKCPCTCQRKVSTNASGRATRIRPQVPQLDSMVVPREQPARRVKNVRIMEVLGDPVDQVRLCSEDSLHINTISRSSIKVTADVIYRTTSASV